MASSSRPRGQRERLPTAKPPKVKTTWDGKAALAAKLRDMGVTCRACLEGPWYHKPHDVGETCYKHMISMGTVSSPLSVAALRKKGDATLARASDRAAVGQNNKTSRDASRPLSEYVRFETKEGMALLYDPSPLDKWIGKSYKWDSRRQCHVEANTGEVLSAEDSEDFQRYVQRHNERRQTGSQADELVKLVATYNPAVEEELRIYIGRLPGEVRRLLAEGKKVYKPPVDKQRHGGVSITIQTAELRHRKDKTKKDAKTKKKRGRKRKEGQEGQESQEEQARRSQCGGDGEEGRATARRYHGRASDPRGSGLGKRCRRHRTSTRTARNGRRGGRRQRRHVAARDAPPRELALGRTRATFRQSELQQWGSTTTPYAKPHSTTTGGKQGHLAARTHVGSSPGSTTTYAEGQNVVKEAQQCETREDSKGRASVFHVGEVCLAAKFSALAFVLKPT